MSDENDLMLCVKIGRPGFDGQDYYAFGGELSSLTSLGDVTDRYKFMAKPPLCGR
jgi:uncharacterized protein YjfI (DUF2170 family)